MLPVHGMQEREGGGMDQATREGAPPEQRALPAHGMQEQGGEGGRTPHPKGEGGTNPNQTLTPFVHGLIKDMGGKPPRPEQPPPPPQGKARGRG